MGYDLISLAVEREEEGSGRDYLAEATKELDAIAKEKEFKALSVTEQIAVMASITFEGSRSWPNGKYFRWNMYYWPLVLKLAKIYGWHPMGTDGSATYNAILAEDKEIAKKLTDEWEGGYTGNARQIVTAKDAQALGVALEKALPDIPDHQIDFPNPVMMSAEDFLESLTFAANAEGDPLTYFSGVAKEKLKQFIGFCKKGDFQIT